MAPTEIIRRIIENNRAEITGWGIDGCKQMFSGFGSPETNKRRAAEVFTSIEATKRIARDGGWAMGRRNKVIAGHLGRVASFRRAAFAASQGI